MSEAVQSASIGLPPDLFQQAFPFFFALDRNLKLRELGPSLQRIVPTLVPGADFTRVFHMLRCDDIPMTFEGLYEALEKRFVLIEHIGSGLQLRGNFVMPPGNSTLLFLASPWISDLKQMTALGINLNDFALHDPMVDLLMVRKDEQNTRDDVSRLNKKLVVRFEQMQMLRNKLSLSLEASQSSAWDCDLARNEITLSQSWEQIVGTGNYHEKNPLAAFFDMVYAEDREQVVSEFTQCRNGLAPELFTEYRFCRDDGSWFWIASRGKVTRRDERGQPLHISGIMTDITERKVIETQLRESQKLEAIGQLTGGLAHDFNNLLGIVVGNLDLIEERLAGADERLRRQFDAAREAALRGADVTRALLAVARRQPLEVQSLDINTLLLEMVPLVRSSAGSAVSLDAQLAPERIVARIDAGGLSNAVLNLVINARDAMQGKAGEHRITLRTSREQITADADPDLAPGDYAVLQVSDNGPGMSELVRAQVFEPFFTTKERGKGTGLGLSMVRGFAEQLGGTARIDSTQGKGTTARLYLPLCATATQSADAGEAARLASLHALNVLDTPPEAELDALVAEAAQVCGTPIALISLIDAHRQWFKAKVGLEAQETARVAAFCAHAILEPGRTLMVKDAAHDLRFSNNPLVRGDPNIRFYAGVPLGDADGQALGTLCVIDRQPRYLNPEQLAQLLALAGRAGALLRARAPAPAAPALAQPAAAPPATPAAQAPEATALRRVLVVDDEAGLCELACAWLQSLGYEATSVLSPDAALAQLAGQHFDVLFTDVVMPGPMDGIDLARAASARQPGLRVLLTSGYARNLNDKGTLPGPLLNKPYRKKDLAEAFKAVKKEAAS